MAHDFDKFPELTNNQFDLYYHLSPHRQITEDFTAKVSRVIDGDTIELEWYGRDFKFPLRIVNIAAPERKERGGKASQSWLESQILRQEVYIKINPRLRVGKWGRLLGYVIHRGWDIGKQSIINAHSLAWENRKDGEIPRVERELKR